MHTRTRRAFRFFNRGMLLLWRLGLGGWVNAWPSVGGRIMVLGHYGRASGRLYRTPVNYAERNGDLYCVAGFGRQSDWYRNVLARPDIDVWLPDGRWQGHAVDCSADPDRLARIRDVLIASGWAAVFAGVNPRRCSDAALEAATADYCVLRILRTAPLSGPGGPGDLLWVWPDAAAMLLPLGRLAVWRRRRP